MRKIYTAGFYGKLFLCLSLITFSFGTLHAQIDIPIGTGTTGNDNTTYPSPLQDFYEGSKMQYLFLASELSAAGMSPGNIHAIKYNVLSLATSVNTHFEIEQFTIKIGSTATTSLGSATWETVSSTVFGPTNYLATLGVNTFLFTTPFQWNGSDNIVIEICGGDPNTSSAVFYTGNPVVPWTTGLSFNGSHTYRADNLDNLCGTATTTNTGPQTTRPNIIFNWSSAAPCTSPPVAGVAVTTPSSVCGGTPVNLTVNGASYGSGQTYEWEKADALTGPWSSVAPSANSAFLTISAPAATTYYRVAVTCSGNTTYSTPASLVVNSSAPVPVITATPTGNVCNGTGVELTTAACDGCTYAWSTGSSTNMINVNANGLYTVTVSNSCGTATVSQEVIVDPSPSLSISAGTALCLGSSATLEANGASTYSWSPATGLNTTTGPTVIASPASTTTYTVTGTIGNCTKTMDVTITVNAVPATPTVTASGPTTFCTGGNVGLTSSAASGNQWYKDGNIITGATNQNYNAIETGSFTVKTSANGCASDASTSTAVTANAIPDQPTITQNGNSLQSSSASGNQWLLNGTAIPGATGATYSPTSSGQYSVQVTANGCTGVASAVFNHTITATNDPVLDNKITIGPNPVEGNLAIRYNGANAKFTATLINMNGVVILQKSFASTLDIDMRRYSAGLYIMRIVNERTRAHVQRKILKQ
jgi:hypothetical protein